MKFLKVFISNSVLFISALFLAFPFVLMMMFGPIGLILGIISLALILLGVATYIEFKGENK